MTGTQSPQGTRFGGSSGATLDFHFSSNTIVKSGGDRVLSQGIWIVDHQSLALPEVFWTDTPRMQYGMEILAELPRSVVSTDMLTVEMVRLLDQYVWHKPADIIFDTVMHCAKLANIMPDVNVRYELSRKRLSIDWLELPAVLTHGDPTYDNVMVRPGTGDIVLTDPIPSTAAVPDLRCVDIGKMMQSMYGFEFMRYGDTSFLTKTTHDQLAVLRATIPGMTDNEWRASQYWCAVHFFRAAPYMPTERIRNAVANAGRQVLHLL